MQFQQVIGQHETQQHLISLVENNRLSHAMLLLGKPGCGLLPLAINFAQFVVSQPPFGQDAAKMPAPALDLFGELIPGAEEDASNGLDPLAEKLMHPDLHFSYPVITAKNLERPVSTDFITEFREFFQKTPYGSGFDWLQFLKAENKQGNISRYECDAIIKKLSLKTFKARYKVLVMWLPEYLGKEGNRLLKMIEEPPEDTLFILASENEKAILPTIISRCQVIRVPPVADADLQQALIEQYGAEPNSARQLALVSEGNVNEALQLLEKGNEDLNDLLRSWLNAVLARGTQEQNRYEWQVKFVDEVSKLGRERQKQLLRYFLQLIEQSVRIRLIGADKLILPESEKDFAMRINKIAGLGQQKIMANELERSIYYIERNANAKILFQALSIKLRAIVVNKVQTGLLH